MSFTVNDVKTVILAEIDETPEDADIITAVNSCLIEFAPLWRVTSTQSITAADGVTWYDRTAGHLSVVSATMDDEDYLGQIDFSYDRASVRFPVAATYVLTSIVLPTAVTLIGSTVGVNDVFKPGIARYCAGLYKCKDNDQNADGLRMQAKGADMIRKAADLLSCGDNRVPMRVPNAYGW